MISESECISDRYEKHLIKIILVNSFTSTYLCHLLRKKENNKVNESCCKQMFYFVIMATG